MFSAVFSHCEHVSFTVFKNFEVKILQKLDYFPFIYQVKQDLARNAELPQQDLSYSCITFNH